ncbi:alpha/beta fold hydrolase [Streptomyces sp. DHE17-7]|uniref:alpha/beta hydrolase n=1 Tax=Streptomyces sp. DHE17-7 TaxID=2759949 RepID=UPI003FA772EF
MTDPATPMGQPPSAQNPASVVRLGIPGGREVTHRDVAANGARFHIAELGDGPLVLLLHGFPQFWWTWRHQLTALADAGFRAVAMDLRGVGGSDRTPRGYDPAGLALDVTGVIRSLGEPDAALVGHDLGGYLAWTAAAMRPKLVRRLAVSSMPHPRRWRSAMLGDVRQSRAGSYIWGFQRPLDPGAPTDGRRRRAGRPAARRLVRPPAARRGGGDGLPPRHVHPLHGALLRRAVPLVGALARPSGRHPVLPPHETAGAGADVAPARLAGPGAAHPERGRFRAVRRSALPLAAVRRARALPARRGPGHFFHRTDQLAERPRTRPVTE